MARTVLLHRQGDVTRDDFSAARHCNIDATLFRIVTLFQHCNVVLRLKSSLRVVPCNITFSAEIRTVDSQTRFEKFVIAMISNMNNKV